LLAFGGAAYLGLMPAVSLVRLTKAFDGRTPAVHEVSLEVADGEFMVLLGPSGCGKTTILRCVAGLEAPTSGDVLIGEQRVNDLPPRDRDVAMVFQSYALYPHLTVRENLGFPLRMRGVPRAEREARLREAAELLGLSALLDRHPAQLSGGERQRVAVGRALVRRPRVFLFDEPLSNLDAKLRGEMRAELVALHRRIGTTMVYVTHDQVEAMTMGQRIAVLDRGVLQQVGTPREVYREPANLFVATFMGTPGMNILEARTHGRTDAQWIGFRPEDGGVRGPGAGGWPGGVTVVEPLGSETLVHVRLDTGADVVCRITDESLVAVGGRVEVEVAAGRLRRFDPEGRRMA
jgi:ABC-type sugar transport system ATPase subunit